MNNISECNQSLEGTLTTNKNVKMDILSNGTSNNFEDEVLSMTDISTIPRLPGDGAQDDTDKFNEPQNIEQDISDRPSDIILHDNDSESGGKQFQFIFIYTCIYFKTFHSHRFNVKIFDM